MMIVLLLITSDVIMAVFTLYIYSDGIQLLYTHVSDVGSTNSRKHNSFLLSFVLSMIEIGDTPPFAKSFAQPIAHLK